ncbi:hypothetical protein K458DRAFT_168635 [Lentithecium fluviatile CBS 122367]|uniref:Uncharacterized protein n=1 Tax=Lentithecium fluviatile CBS 122367 TaxID=1168545 RepID=A0A6G1JBT8_9PLEO|nr:hypothetical protein K458DRAFT_168635 [Lentithecium fluviatile CBS 122367]
MGLSIQHREGALQDGAAPGIFLGSTQGCTAMCVLWTALFHLFVIRNDTLSVASGIFISTAVCTCTFARRAPLPSFFPLGGGVVCMGVWGLRVVTMDGCVHEWIGEGGIHAMDWGRGVWLRKEGKARRQPGGCIRSA